jgi:hypothetical protein
MNKYYIKLPYSYIQYGELSGTVYAESEEEAEELIRDINNIHDQVFDDSDGDSTDYSYDNVEIELEEEDTDELPISRSTETSNTSYKLPSYYLSDINLI